MRRAQRGMTLVELTVTIGVIALLGIGIAASILLAARAQVTAIHFAEVQDVGTISSAWLYRELRELRIPASVGLQSLSASELRFTDWNGDGYAYTLSGGNLMRSRNGGAAQPFADGVTDFIIAYRRVDGTPATSASEVSRIDFSYNVVRGEISRRFGGQVWPRSTGPFIANWREL